MIFTNEQIQRLKNKVFSVDFSTKNKDESKNLAEIYRIANRTPYQTAKLFQYAYKFIVSSKESDIIECVCKHCIFRQALISEICNYELYKMNSMCEGKIKFIITDNSECVDEVIDVVFGEVINGQDAIGGFM